MQGVSWRGRVYLTGLEINFLQYLLLYIMVITYSKNERSILGMFSAATRGMGRSEKASHRENLKAGF